MALIKDYYETRFEITKPNCYWKIIRDEGIKGGKEKLEVRIACYKDINAAKLDRDYYHSVWFSFVPDLSEGADNFIKQAYLYAKSLPEFVDAVDA